MKEVRKKMRALEVVAYLLLVVYILVAVWNLGLNNPDADVNVGEFCLTHFPNVVLFFIAIGILGISERLSELVEDKIVTE